MKLFLIESEKSKKLSLNFFFALILFLTLINPSSTITCLNNESQPSSWFFLLKYPHKIQSISNIKFAYFDNWMSSKFTKFRLMNHFIDGKDQAFYLTMNQINNNQELQVIAWNDDPANNQKASTEHTAHSKGVIIYDSLAENAIYIVHSIPKYPNFDKDGKVSIKIADSQLKYGQNILCMSLDIENLEKVISGLNIINSIIYHNTLKDQNFQNLKEFFQKNRRQIKNKAQTKTNEFKVNGISFWGFYKNPYYYGCIFENIMIPVLKSNMLVQSWGRPYQTPSCNQYECLNIKKIHIDGDLLGHWNSVEDHSKWSITVYGYFICSGDMNRMISQTKRGGAFFCFQDKGLWTALNSAIVDKERCRESK